MIITCEECSTRFSLDDSLIKPEGSKVRCSRCKHVFTTFPVIQDALEPDFDVPEDMDFEEPDFSPSDAPPDDTSGDISFDGPDIDEDDSTIDYSGDNDLDFDDQDIDFDEIEFDEAPDFGETDFPESVFSDSEAQNPETGLEMESEPEMLSSDMNEDIQDDEEELTPALSFKDTDLDFDDTDLNLEPQDPDFEEVHTIEDDNDPESLNLLDLEDDQNSTDIEIRFGEDDNSLELQGLSLEKDASEDDLEEIEFETEDSEADLELLFDDDPDADFIFEDSAENIEDLEPSLELDAPLETLSQPPEKEESESEFELEEEPDFFIEEDVTAPLEDHDGKKFSEYDSVLDQDPEQTEPGPALGEDNGDDIEDPDLLAPEEPVEEVLEESALIDTPSAADTRKKRAKKTKTGISAPIKILFLLFLLVIAAYVASLKLGADIPYLSEIQIPYLTDALKPAPQPQPALKPVPNEASINGRFVSNPTAGELFIVTGRIENPSTIAYSHIKVKGTLLTKDKTKAGTQIAYCGNIISEETLKTGNISDITNQLTVKQGLQNTNVNIKPGASVLFMLVFSNLPENLTNFTVEVVNFETQLKK